MQQEAGLEAGDVTISARSWETFSFGVYHLQELVNGLHTQYHRDGEGRRLNVVLIGRIGEAKPPGQLGGFCLPVAPIAALLAASLLRGRATWRVGQ